jgi:hypothetical protein
MLRWFARAFSYGESVDPYKRPDRGQQGWRVMKDPFEFSGSLMRRPDTRPD